MTANPLLVRGKQPFRVIAARSINLSSFSRSDKRHRHDILRRAVATPPHQCYPETKSILVRSLRTMLENKILGPLGSPTREDLNEAENQLLESVSQRNKAGFEQAKSILLRLAKEQAYLQSQKEKVEESERNAPINYVVDSFILNQVIDCWRTCWRDHMIDVSPADILKLIDTLESNGVVSDSRTVTMVIDGITLRGDHHEAPLLAQWLLDRRMQLAESRPELRPDTVMITNVIRAWGKSKRIEAPEMAEGLLQLMHDLHENGEWIDSGPNTLSYSATMEAWANSKSREASEKMEALLEEMKQSSVEAVRPDRVSYLYVINSWVHSKSPDGPDRANALMQEMLQLYNNGNDDVVPDVSIFSNVMVAYARRGRAKEVETLHEQLQDVYSSTGDPRFKPNADCAKALIIALSKHGAQAEAEGLLDELVERALLEQDPRIMPKRSYFVDVLVGWTKDRDKKRASEQSQRVLMRLLELSKSGYPELMPDAKSFEKVMQAWSKTNNPKAPMSVDTLLSRMKNEYTKTKNEAVKPNARTFELALLTWSRSRQPEAPDRAEALLQEMERTYLDGDESMRPSRGAYTTLMVTWQRSKRKNASSKVLDAFEDLRQKYIDGEIHLRPDAYVYSVVVDSFAQQGDAVGAQTIFDTMLEEYCNGNEEAKPDIESYNKLLRAYTFSKDNEKAQKAEKLFQGIKNLGLGLSPNRQTLIEMISVWSFSHDDPIAAEMCEQYFVELKRKNYEATVATYTNVINALNKSKDPTAVSRAKKLLEALIHDVEEGFVQKPFFNPYKKFLQTVSRSNIPRRNEQAKKLLRSLNPKTPITRKLLPPL
ncbi:unnamed protein product [Cylindrotheca closterium]|uniref:Pentacotripeptide-repeat region of PRORP domain-containing protein n=1 Tax=Cylindrotheca closterium TaxID=2856 RepID=A0AAD2FQ73_9STRA|nr:unnamed protein product [Cylindrotheca closterium]